MTARPILFSAPMVRAILSGRKTQTRRVVRRPEKLPPEPRGYRYKEGGLVRDYGKMGISTYPISCPFGAPGDTLWVREALCRNREPDEKDDEGRPIYFCRYAATPDVLCGFWSPLMILGGFYRQPRGYTVPSIHMPRAYSRITLRVAGVRVERLQAISAADAIAEGCAAVPVQSFDCDSRSPVVEYRELWESINGKGSWAEDPYVWVVDFERVADTRAAA